MSIISRDPGTSVGSSLKTNHAEDSAQRTPIEHSLACLLDHVHRVLSRKGSRAAEIEAAVDQLFQGLGLLRRSSTKEEWRKMLDVGRTHELCELVHQDPFTSRAFHKPRGYAGDAVMMDYIYSHEEDWQPPQATPLGQAIFNYTTQAPASAGVRERRCHIAELLDGYDRESAAPHVLAVAAGHLREASLSTALRRKRFGRFVAMDADAESVKEVERCYARFGVEPVVANVRKMLTGRLELGSFDLIYTTGLYDYLADSTAKRLTANLFKSLRPGGRLVVANFLPDIADVGYMEMFMDWHLIYRDRHQMLMLADDITHSSIDEVRIRSERNENVVVMEMTKRSLPA